jgi:putative hydrolase of the HAD superfamily
LVIFDMDDTLYPEADFVLSGYHAAAEVAWQDLGCDLEPELRRRFMLGQRGDLFTTALKTLDVAPPQDYVKTRLVPAYREHLPRLHPYVEVRSVLAALKARGHRLALLSDGWADVQRRKFEALALSEFFDAVVFTDDFGRNAWKPSTVGFERVLKVLGFSADQAMYVADNPLKDFIAPNHLGMSSVRVVRPGTEHMGAVAAEPTHAARWRVRALSELIGNRARPIP